MHRTGVEGIYQGLREGDWVGSLLVRVVVGLLFVISGGGKLFDGQKREKMRETIRDAKIPMPNVNALLVSGVELVGGLMLLAGFLTPVAAGLLAVVMVVALATVRVKALEAEGVLGWLGEFVYLPETVIASALVWLLLAGPGLVSLDALLWI